MSVRVCNLAQALVASPRLTLTLTKNWSGLTFGVTSIPTAFPFTASSRSSATCTLTSEAMRLARISEMAGARLEGVSFDKGARDLNAFDMPVDRSLKAESVTRDRRGVEEGENESAKGRRSRQHSPRIVDIGLRESARLG